MFAVLLFFQSSQTSNLHTSTACLSLGSTIKVIWFNADRKDVVTRVEEGPPGCFHLMHVEHALVLAGKMINKREHV